jgi:hypothetical protein
LAERYIYVAVATLLSLAAVATIGHAPLGRSWASSDWCDQGSYEEKYRKLPTKLLVFPPFSTDLHHC